MKKILIAGVFCLAINSLSAQPWMDKFQGPDKVKLEDVVKNFQTMQVSAEDDENDLPANSNVKEGHNYQFDRWRWYWEQHLDAEGYMVSPSKTYQEWQAYKQGLNIANKTSKTTANTSNWSFQGPTASAANGKGIGRIQKVVFHPADSNTFWVCTAGGGAWMTTTNGTSWTCMTDQLPVLGVSDIAYNPLNPSVIYLSTGDRDATDNSSLGLFKSTDGGATWNISGYQLLRSDAKRISTILVNPLDTASILITSSDGIYNSRDGGSTWTLRQSGNFRDLLYRPNDTMILYATSAYNGNSQIFRSGDGGKSWKQVTSTTLVGNAARISIAVSPAAPNTVKAIVSNSLYGLDGIYTSIDTGNNFTKTFNPFSCNQNYLANSPTPGSSNCDGQGWYDLAIAISPLDSNKMVIGGVNTWYSTNGGNSWQLANQWTASSVKSVDIVHADKHYQVYQPLRPNVLFECNDGGIYKTLNNPSTTGWMDLTNGLGITQFYRMAVANYSTSALGGAQDNGSKRINPGSATNEITGGDGMNCEMDPIDQNYYYTASQYGTIIRNSNSYISNNIPGKPAGAWLTPYKLHPLNGSRIVAGLDLVYESDNNGDSWTAISTKLSSKLIDRVVFAPSNINTVYAVWGNVVRRTIDNGANWTNMIGGVPGTISDIVVDKKDKQHFWVTFSGYGVNKVAEYDTTNGWQSQNTGLPNVPVNCILQDTSNNTLYIGTDVAVFYRDKTMTTWALWNTNLPSAEVTDMGINYSTGDLWASTYGRGLWKTPRFTFSSNPAGVSIIPYAADVIRIVPNPSNGSFDIQTENAGFTGQATNVNIIDMTGKIVWSGKRSFTADGSLHIDAASLSKATYIVDVTALNGMKAKAKMVMQ